MTLRLTEDHVRDLMFFVHDKDHIVRRGNRMPAMERALRGGSRVAPLLYRGLYPGKELQWIDRGHADLVTDAYTSFSQSVDFAKQFATKSKTIMVLLKGRGFDYSSWMRDRCREETDPQVRDENDLDFMEETCDEEQEWIVGFPTRLHVVSDAKGRGKLSGLRVITVTPQETYRAQVETAYAIVPQDPDFSLLQRLSSPVLDCLGEALQKSMGQSDPLATVILGILSTRDPNEPVRLVDMFGNEGLVDPIDGGLYGGMPLVRSDDRGGRNRWRQDETAGETYEVPAGVKKAAQRGLDLRKKHGRGGIGPGQARARQLVRSRSVSESVVRKINGYLQRHDGYAKDASGSDPSTGYIAWLLWGGDAAKTWSSGIVARLDKKETAMLETSAGKKRKKQGPCWPGYVKVGTKIKDGREVPNCVPNPRGRIKSEREQASVVHTMRVLEVAADRFLRSMLPRDRRQYLLERAGDDSGAHVEVLHNSGWRHRGGDDRVQFHRHEEYPGQMLMIRDSGPWTHYDENDATIGEGSDHDSLREHLEDQS